jgi:hypothetical protein
VLAGERAGHEVAGRLRHDPRQHGALHRAHPVRPGLAQRVLGDEQVRHAAQPAPRDRELRREQAPAARDDHVEALALEQRPDPERERVVVVQHPRQR